MITENKIYNPAGQPKEWLIEHFVVRTKVFEKIFKDIQTGKMKYPEQHYLIQGQRGMGKTTMLLRLKYEIENTPDLNAWLVPVFFNEESYDLTTLSNLWEKLFKYLDDLWQTGGKYYKKTDEFVGKTDYEKKCFDYLLQILKEEKKKLVVFFDNFGQLFLDNLKEKEQHRLREILMNCPEVRIVGASAIVLKDLHDYSKPFFEFFKIINLHGLNKTETFELIQKLQEKSGTKIDLEKNKAKIETLAILTGGVIRTIMLLYEAVLADKDGTALHDLEMILDRISPLYKHRIEDLPVQQRRIVDVIAKNWDAISAKDIANNIREDGQHISTKIISAQLQQLEKNNVIEKKQTTTKNHLYQLRERFFNIWYLMRHGDRYDKCRVVWLTKFLEMWYEDENDLNLFITEHIKHLKSGKYHAESAILITEALSNSHKLDVNGFELLIKETSAILTEDQKKLLPDFDNQKVKTISKYLIDQNYNEAIRILNSIKNKSHYLNLLLVSAYIHTNRLEDATQIIDLIIPENNQSALLLGISYYYLKNHQKVIEILDKYTGDNQGNKYLFMAKSYFGSKDYKKSIDSYKKAAENKNLKAFNPLIILLFREKQWEEVEKYSLQGIKLGINHLNIYLIQAYFYSEDANKMAKAKKIINSELRADPNNPDYNYLKAMYEYFYDDRSKSLIYFQTAHENYLKIKSSSVEFQFNLHMLLHTLIDIKKDKISAKKILEKENSIQIKDSILLYRALLHVWDSEYNAGLSLLLKWFNDYGFDISKIDGNIIKDILLLLITKKQYHSLYKLFQKDRPEIQEIFKPIYYALMHCLKDEYPNEIIKMGEELKQPVEDIMKRVEEMAIEYK
jgi:hypothetical protein